MPKYITLNDAYLYNPRIGEHIPLYPDRDREEAEQALPELSGDFTLSGSLTCKSINVELLDVLQKMQEAFRAFLDRQLTACKNVCPDCGDPAHLCWKQLHPTYTGHWIGIEMDCSGAQTWFAVEIKTA